MVAAVTIQTRIIQDLSCTDVQTYAEVGIELKGSRTHHCNWLAV
jgi:hypothetical protein